MVYLVRAALRSRSASQIRQQVSILARTTARFSSSCSRRKLSTCRSEQQQQQAMSMSMPRAAIVRNVPATFADALAMEKPSDPIDVKLAKQQHLAYVKVLKDLGLRVIELPAEDAFPDCPFVEDTAVVLGSQALITRPGAPSRQGEELLVKQALERLGLQTSQAQAPAKIDGGDVLFAGGMLFVGQSARTNEEGLQALASVFPDVRVVPVRVPKSLHLKTVLSCVASDVLAVEDSPEARAMFSSIQREAPFLKSVAVSPAGAANTLLLGDDGAVIGTRGVMRMYLRIT
ncbi:hypothetical protein Mapa_006251 [Marchantia paleacea]|nr:hypothetical protein Mapa_006251 [Marchantia paleacea]